MMQSHIFCFTFSHIYEIQYFVITLQFPSDVFDRVEAAASIVDSLKNLVFSLGKDSSAVDRQKWLTDSTSLLQKIRDATNELVSPKYFICKITCHLIHLTYFP